MRDYIRHYMESAERLESIIPTIDPDGRGVPFLFFRDDPPEGELINVQICILARCRWWRAFFILWQKSHAA